MRKFLAIPDMHLGDKMPYGEFVQDGRVQERIDIFEQIYNSITDNHVEDVILLGDVTDKRNPSTYTYDLLFEFLSNMKKRLPIDGRIYILTGNHDTLSDMATLAPLNKILNALDIRIIDKVTQIDDYVFLPYRRKSDYGVKTNEELRDVVMQELNNLTELSGMRGKYLFSHITISNFNVNGQDTSLFDEMVLNKEELNTIYKNVFNGHIHEYEYSGNIYNVGNLFTSVVGDSQKNIILVEKDGIVNHITLSEAEIIKVENPTAKDIEKFIEDKTILKVYITKQYTVEELSNIKKELDKCYGYQLIEKLSQERSKKIILENGKNVTDLSLEELVDLFGKQKGIDQNLLKKGLSLIK